MNMNKIKIYYNLFLSLALLFVLNISLISQENIENKYTVTPNAPKVKINTCAYYKFYPKDTLIYSIESKDSIIIRFGVPLHKTRNEELMVICDSIGANNHFYLQLQTIKFNTKEWTTKYDAVNHNKNEWLNRKVFIEIDSVGKRYSIYNEDTTKIGLASGGAFQPYLFFNFEKACSDTGDPWVITDEYDNLVENGIPMPIIQNSLILKNLGYVDTLGFKTNRLRITKTGQGSIYFKQKNETIRFTNIMAVGSYLLIGIGDAKVPIFFHQEQDQKIHYKSGKTFKEKGNNHYTDATFKLIKYNRINFDITTNSKNQINKKNKK